MTTGNQIAITFEVSIHFASNLAPFLLMVTFYKNVIIFLIGIFFGCHVTKINYLLKEKNTKIKFESSQKQIFETDTTYH